MNPEQTIWPSFGFGGVNALRHGTRNGRFARHNARLSCANQSVGLGLVRKQHVESVRFVLHLVHVFHRDDLHIAVAFHFDPDLQLLFFH